VKTTKKNQAYAHLIAAYVTEKLDGNFAVAKNIQRGAQNEFGVNQE
jgi:hypothetical protein